jgi:hypothetical protein
MGPLTDAEFDARLAAGVLVRKYQEDVDRASAREKLETRAAERARAEADAARDEEAPPSRARSRARAPRAEKSTLEKIANASVTRAVATTLVRGLMGALLGPTRRRR